MRMNRRILFAFLLIAGALSLPEVLLQPRPASLPSPFIFARAAMAPYCFIICRICMYCLMT